MCVPHDIFHKKNPIKLLTEGVMCQNLDTLRRLTDLSLEFTGVAQKQIIIFGVYCNSSKIIKFVFEPKISCNSIELSFHSY